MNFILDDFPIITYPWPGSAGLNSYSSESRIGSIITVTITELSKLSQVITFSNPWKLENSVKTKRYEIIREKGSWRATTLNNIIRWKYEEWHSPAVRYIPESKLPIQATLPLPSWKSFWRSPMNTPNVYAIPSTIILHMKLANTMTQP